MGLLDKIGGAIDKTSKSIAYENKRRQDTTYIKEAILDRFDVKLLRNLCRYNKIGEPDPTKLRWSTGNIVKERVNKSHWIKHASKGINLPEIKDYAKKHKIDFSDIEEEERRLERERIEKYR
jgi:hypothetical protein